MNPPRINIWLMGGLGNILFQHAYGEYLKSHGFEVYYVSNLTEKNLITRMLGFTIHESFVKRIISTDNVIHVNFLSTIVIVALSKPKFLNKYSAFVHGEVSYSRNQFGYHQATNVLDKTIRPYLKGQSLFANHKLNSRRVRHVRAGDTTWHQDNEVFQFDKELVLVGSLEDLKLLNLPIENSGSGDAFKDFEFLATSRILYTANSTFSWWAAHIGPEEKKIYMSRMLVNQLGHYLQNKNSTLTILDEK